MPLFAYSLRPNGPFARICPTTLKVETGLVVPMPTLPLRSIWSRAVCDSGIPIGGRSKAKSASKVEYLEHLASRGLPSVNKRLCRLQCCPQCSNFPSRCGRPDADVAAVGSPQSLAPCRTIAARLKDKVGVVGERREPPAISVPVRSGLKLDASASIDAAVLYSLMTSVPP